MFEIRDVDDRVMSIKVVESGKDLSLIKLEVEIDIEDVYIIADEKEALSLVGEPLRGIAYQVSFESAGKEPVWLLTDKLREIVVADTTDYEWNNTYLLAKVKGDNTLSFNSNVTMEGTSYAYQSALLKSLTFRTSTRANWLVLVVMDCNGKTVEVKMFLDPNMSEEDIQSYKRSLDEFEGRIIIMKDLTYSSSYGFNVKELETLAVESDVMPANLDIARETILSLCKDDADLYKYLTSSQYLAKLSTEQIMFKGDLLVALAIELMQLQLFRNVVEYTTKEYNKIRATLVMGKSYILFKDRPLDDKNMSAMFVHKKFESIFFQKYMDKKEMISTILDEDKGTSYNRIRETAQFLLTRR